jgi:P-type Cu+ transporter
VLNTMTNEVAESRERDSASTLERVSIPVSGMTCAACQSFIQRTLADVAGVESAAVNLMLHNATVTFDPQIVSTAGLVEKIRNTGYGAEMPVADISVIEAQEKNDEDQLREYREVRLKAVVSFVAGIVAMIVSLPLMGMTSTAGFKHMSDPFLSWSMRALAPALRGIMPWLYAVSDNTLRCCTGPPT